MEAIYHAEIEEEDNEKACIQMLATAENFSATPSPAASQLSFAREYSDESIDELDDYYSDFHYH